MIDKLNAEVVRIVKNPDTRSRLENQGVDVVGGTAAELAAFIRDEIAKCAKIAKTAGIRVD